MPLLGPPPAPETPLSQGDVLADVPLHGSAADGAPCSFDAKFGLVVSRECAAAHKGQVLVASIVAVKDRLISEDALKQAKKTDVPHEELPRPFRALLKALDAARDGGLAPDRVYLGHLPGNTQRLVAKLDEITTVQLPEGADERMGWVSKRRVARLTSDALRALPTRLFWALSRVGFDDYEWLPEPDLREVCAAGTAANGALVARHATLQLELAEAERAADNENKLKNLRADVNKAGEAQGALENELAPYKAELARRAGS